MNRMLLRHFISLPLFVFCPCSNRACALGLLSRANLDAEFDKTLLQRSRQEALTKSIETADAVAKQAELLLKKAAAAIIAAPPKALEPRTTAAERAAIDMELQSAARTVREEVCQFAAAMADPETIVAMQNELHVDFLRAAALGVPVRNASTVIFLLLNFLFCFWSCMLFRLSLGLLCAVRSCVIVVLPSQKSYPCLCFLLEYPLCRFLSLPCAAE